MALSDMLSAAMFSRTIGQRFVRVPSVLMGEVFPTHCTAI